MPIKRIQNTANLVIPLLAIGAVFANKVCDTGCTYLYGFLFGVDLNYLGIFLAVVILLSSLPVSYPFYRRTAGPLRGIILSFSIGAGVVLLHFQLVNRVFCPFCIVYGTLLLILFALNFNKTDRFTGPVSFIAGLLLFVLFFEGSAMPVFQF